MEKLGSYELTDNLTSQNSGYSVWGFGKKNGNDFFIKQFLSPKFPDNDTISSAASIERKRKKCERFEHKKASIYKAVNENSDGNAVRIEEFFRIESKYYISMRKIDSLNWSIDTIAGFSEKEKRYICKVISHAIAGLHKGRVVHADLKHDNILFMMSSCGFATAKIIDFDSGFLEEDPPTEGEEIVGDQIYFSPEACLTFMGESPELTCKMDIFALGILFHQYFTGDLPQYDDSLGNYAGEVVAKGGTLTVSDDIPVDIRTLLESMLDADPRKRPSALDVHAFFAGQPAEQKESMAEIAQPGNTVVSPIKDKVASTVFHSTTSSNPFFRPGDL